MAIADTSATRLAYVSEVTQGVTPATPAFKTGRYTGESLVLDVDTITSEEIRADRNVSDLIRVGQRVTGGFDFELSYGAYDEFLESLFHSTFTANSLKNGIAQTKFFTFEKTFELGATDAYHRFAGVESSELSLKIEAGKIITGSFGLSGFSGTAATTVIAGATYAAAPSEALLNATTDFAALTTTGLASTPRIMSMDVSFTNNLREQRAVGSFGLVGLGAGRFEVTGSLRAYFEDNALFNAYIAGTSFTLSFTLGSITAKKYTVSLPVVKIANSKIVAGGNNADVMADIEFRALFDATSAATCTITRAVA